ncbi:MAG: hypothetical protein AABZ44_01985, partial [Elusimicrobiota bacterium]
WVTLALAFVMSPAQSQRLPQMGQHKSWSDAEKKEFLSFIRSGKQAPAQGGTLTAATGAGALKQGGAHKARYITVDLVSDTLLTYDANGKLRSDNTSLGGRLLLGSHIFSWMRFYTGGQYSRMGRDRYDGMEARVEHWKLPAGLEFALIPLGTPQTRYVLLRAGASAHYFATKAEKTDFTVPLADWRGAWDLGLGYEWQIPGSRWRLHLSAEGYRSIERKASEDRFAGLMGSGGLVFTF